jgi:hypothetical protein
VQQQQQQQQQQQDVLAKAAQLQCLGVALQPWLPQCRQHPAATAMHVQQLLLLLLLEVRQNAAGQAGLHRMQHCLTCSSLTAAT